MRRELSEIKEVEFIDTGGTRPRSVEAGNSAAEKTDESNPDKPRIPIVDIGPASADDAAGSKIETVKENEI